MVGYTSMTLNPSNRGNLEQLALKGLTHSLLEHSRRHRQYGQRRNKAVIVRLNSSTKSGAFVDLLVVVA